MTTFKKITATAAALATVATSALAVETQETSIPDSLQSSELVESYGVNSVTTFTEHTEAPNSLRNRVVEQLEDGQVTEVNSDFEENVPASLRGSRLYQR
ncbi:hypothetical protein [Pseudooceanicola sp. MF1-13]|uniref:hypothetical protein n=1 Tax=Pseudooceanicola sp. MF1-13 TaxID=3379095 RepID=UPI0038922FFA